MDKRSQAAMEFLMSYGWVIFLVLIALAVLISFGIFDTKNLMPDNADSGRAVKIKDFTVNENSVTFVFDNVAGKPLYNFSVLVRSCNNGAGAESDPIRLAKDGKATVTVRCENTGDLYSKFASELEVHYTERMISSSGALASTSSTSGGDTGVYTPIIEIGSLKGDVVPGEKLICDVLLTACGYSSWEAGLTYCLDADINNYAGTCFDISADNVTFNGQDHYIDQTRAANDRTFVISSQNNIAIADLVIRESNMSMNVSNSDSISLENIDINASVSYGIYFNNTNHSILNDIRVVNVTGSTYAGIELNGGTENSATGISATQAYIGMKIINSTYNALVDSNFSNNRQTGVLFRNSASYNSFSDSVTNSNIEGISILYDSEHNVLSGIVSNYNSGFGIYMTADYNALTGIEANYDGNTGIYLYQSDYNNLSIVTSNSHLENGIYLEESSYNILTEINASGNDLGGITFDIDSNSNIIDGGYATSNGDYGLGIGGGSQDNLVIDFIAESNTGYGIYFSEAFYTALTNITLNSNSYGLISVDSSNNDLDHIVADSNANDGIMLFGGSNNDLSYITTSSNLRDGIYVLGEVNTNFTNVAADSNMKYGFNITAGASGLNFNNVNATGNTLQDFNCTGASAGGSGNKFNTVVNCTNGWPVENHDYYSCDVMITNCEDPQAPGFFIGGNSYCLANDIGVGDSYDTCLSIYTANIVLNGQGYTIHGDGMQTGIGLIEHSGIWISNIALDGFAANCIYIRDTNNIHISHASIQCTGYGMMASFISDSSYTNINVTSSSQDGIWLQGGSRNNLTNITSNTNAGHGISFTSIPANNSLLDITAIGNTQSGINIVWGATGTSLDNVVSLSNGDDFYCTAADANGSSNVFSTVTPCLDGWPVLGVDYNVCELISSCSDDDTLGFWQSGNMYCLINDMMDQNDSCLIVDASDITIEGNDHTLDGDDSAPYGIRADGDNIIIRNVIVTDFFHGVYLLGENSSADNINAISNSVNGISLQWGPNQNVTNSYTAFNSYYGVSVNTLNRGVVAGLYSTYNGYSGVQVIASSNIAIDGSQFFWNMMGIEIQSDTNITISNVDADSNWGTDFACAYTTGTIGTGNCFNTVDKLSCDAWPVLTVDYNLC